MQVVVVDYNPPADTPSLRESFFALAHLLCDHIHRPPLVQQPVCWYAIEVELLALPQLF